MVLEWVVKLENCFNLPRLGWISRAINVGVHSLISVVMVEIRGLLSEESATWMQVESMVQWIVISLRIFIIDFQILAQPWALIVWRQVQLLAAITVASAMYKRCAIKTGWNLNLLKEVKRGKPCQHQGLINLLIQVLADSNSFSLLGLPVLVTEDLNWSSCIDSLIDVHTLEKLVVGCYPTNLFPNPRLVPSSQTCETADLISNSILQNTHDVAALLRIVNGNWIKELEGRLVGFFCCSKCRKIV